jgi:hypothetical protein
LDATIKIASYEDNKTQLFELYRRFRYGELVAYGLMNGATRIEKTVKISVLGLLAISLLTGSTSYLNPPILSPFWAVFSALATLLAAYSLIAGSGAKQFAWFGLARKFHAVANEVEFFSRYVKLGKISEDELMKTWKQFSERLAELLSEGGIEHQQYEGKYRDSLVSSLATTLKNEGNAP